MFLVSTIIIEEIENYALVEIENILLHLGKSLKNVDGMPLPDFSLTKHLDNRLLNEEMNYDPIKLAQEHDRLT